jgi:AraC family transcriptional regulator
VDDRDASPEVAVRTLLATPSLTVRHVCCRGDCKGHGPEECADATELVFPYRGMFARHLGRDQAVAEPSQVLFFNAGEGYRVSHPVTGGDACLSLAIAPALLQELTPRPLVRTGENLAFHNQRKPIDTRSQALATRLRRRLFSGQAQPLEAEGLALSLVQHALNLELAPSLAASAGRRKMADRAKFVLASDLGRRWTLAEIAAELGGSPVYLTQVFRQAEGLPLYRYQLRLRLARALDLLDSYSDLTALALDLGFSSHSHFTAAFREAFGCSPTAFRRKTRGAALEAEAEA